MADHSQHREAGFDYHTLIPSAFGAQLDIGGRAIFIAETEVCQGDSLLIEGGDKAVEGFVRDIHRLPELFHDLSGIAQQTPQAHANRPAAFVAAFAAQFSGTAPSRIGNSSSIRKLSITVNRLVRPAKGCTSYDAPPSCVAGSFDAAAQQVVPAGRGDNSGWTEKGKIRRIPRQQGRL